MSPDDPFARVVLLLPTQEMFGIGNDRTGVRRYISNVVLGRLRVFTPLVLRFCHYRGHFSRRRFLSNSSLAFFNADMIGRR